MIGTAVVRGHHPRQSVHPRVVRIDRRGVTAVHADDRFRWVLGLVVVRAPMTVDVRVAREPLPLRLDGHQHGPGRRRGCDDKELNAPVFHEDPLFSIDDAGQTRMASMACWPANELTLELQPHGELHRARIAGECRDRRAIARCDSAFGFPKFVWLVALKMS